MTGAGTATTAAAVDAEAGRATRAVVDLDVLAANVRHLRGMLSPGAELLAVVKANAYGHGATPIAREALAAGASWLAVATVGEGARLRRDGVTAPILVFGPINEAEAPTALRLDLDVTVATESLLDAVAAAARSLPLPRPAAVHVKVDTGMRRHGATPEEAVALARRVAADPALRPAGVSTHFASADDPDESFTAEQSACLDRVLSALVAVGIRPERVHAANSAATLRSRRYDYDMVRVGIALYGLPPSPAMALPPELRPIMSLRSRVARVIELEPGDGVGYGRTYRAAGRERAALVPIGYADGYRRALSGQGWMAIAGGRAPVLGRVSMDQTVVGLPTGAGTRVGDEVLVVGTDPDQGAPTAVDLAALLDTIPYEVVAGVAERVPRQYVRDGRPVPADDRTAAEDALTAR